MNSEKYNSFVQTMGLVLLAVIVIKMFNAPTEGKVVISGVDGDLPVVVQNLPVMPKVMDVSVTNQKEYPAKMDVNILPSEEGVPVNIVSSKSNLPVEIKVQPEGEKAPAVMRVSIVGTEQPLSIKSEGNLPVEIKAQPKGEAPAVMKVHIEGIDAPLPVTLGEKKQQEWEYKVVTTFPPKSLSREGREAMSYSTINIDQTVLNQLGKQGWELLDTVMEVETAYPNFGKSDLHTGIKTNVRPQKISLIFRRKVR